MEVELFKRSKTDLVVSRAKMGRIRVNKLMEELATMALAEYDLETRFKVRASRGSEEKAVEIVEKLKEDYEYK